MFFHACALLAAIALVLLRDASANLHTCVHITNKIRKNGDGSTEESCMGCDPVHKECYPTCQNMISTMFRNCADVCIPDGYYYDPSKF